MTEAVQTVNDFWFDSLGFQILRTPKAAANIASRRISEKTGMRLVATEERDFVSGRAVSEIWELTDSEWQKHKLRTEQVSSADVPTDPPNLPIRSRRT